MKKIKFDIENNILVLSISGDILLYDDNENKQKLYDIANDDKITQIVIDTTHLQQWDSSLVAIIFELAKITLKRNIKLKRVNFPDGLNRLINLALSTAPPIFRATTVPTRRIQTAFPTVRPSAHFSASKPMFSSRTWASTICGFPTASASALNLGL